MNNWISYFQAILPLVGNDLKQVVSSLGMIWTSDPINVRYDIVYPVIERHHGKGFEEPR